MSMFARLVANGTIQAEKPSIPFVVPREIGRKSIVKERTIRIHKAREHKLYMTCRIRNGSRSSSSIAYEFAEYGGYDRLVGYHQSLKG